jgi:ankyrin repeat protein
MDIEFYKELFELIKNNKWGQIEEKINSNKEINVNIRDGNNNYLVTYAVMYNSLDLVKLLIEKGCKIDVLDSEERSLLYIPIKFMYNDMLEYLLEINDNTIGINITDIKDKTNRIALHYAIKMKNIFAIEKLLKYGSNSNIIDNNGYSAIHYAIFTRDIKICELLLKYIDNINIRCSTGETALHIATNLQLNEICEILIKHKINPNIQDYTHEFTSLHYATNLNTLKLLKLYIENGGNVNIQDVFGNTVLHYAIIENNYEIINYLVNSDTYNKINFNLWNIDGKIPLHILLENYIENFDEYLSKIIEKSNLTLRESDGNSCFMYLVNLKIYNQYKTILVKKKLDIYIKNKKDVTLYEMLKESELKELIDLIVESYIYRLKLNPDSWKNEWENICSKDFDISNNDYKQILRKHKSIKNNDELEKACSNKIREGIITNIEQIKENRKTCNMESYPLNKNKVCITISEGEKLNVCTFTGSTLDILIGLIYLLKKHNNICSTLTTNFIENKNLYAFYKSIGIIIGTKTEFLNFEIIWINNKLYLVNEFIDKISECQDKKTNFIVIPLGIEMKEGSHANYIVYDLKNKTVERFEPHGSTTPPGLNYHPDLLDEMLETKFKSIDEKIKYYAPKDYLPKIGFQMMDITESKQRKIGDPGGFCALWALWYIDMRMIYNELKPKELVEILINSIKRQNISVKNMIRNYALNIIKDRDEILNKVGLDINDWLNDQYQDTQIDEVIKYIKSIINSL